MKATLNNFWRSRLALLFVPAMLLTPSLPAQTDTLTVVPVPKVSMKRGETVSVTIQAQLKPGFHVNSNTPSEDYLIPLRLVWDAKPLESAAVQFPPAHKESYQFTTTPLSVFTGEIPISTTFKVPAASAPGLGIALGKLRYQACNQTMCLPPKTVEVRVPFEIR